MPKILSVSLFKPPYEVKQEQAVELTRSLFNEKYQDIERLLKVFQNGEIEKRNVCMPLDWYGKEHDFEERNQLYIEHAVDFGIQAVLSCLQGDGMVEVPIEASMIDPIFSFPAAGFQHEHRCTHYEPYSLPRRYETDSDLGARLCRGGWVSAEHRSIAKPFQKRMFAFP